MFDSHEHKEIEKRLHLIEEQLRNLITVGDTIMTSIADFAAQMAIFNAQIDTAVADIATELATLNATIATLQASPGVVSAADQASLDAIQAHGQVVATKLAALDTINPPAVPVSPVAGA